jgi:TRAP-type C4-dicarboxylate transport system permease small subunit
MKTIRTILDSTLERVLVFLMVVMVLNVLWQVFTRFVLNSPATFTEELARYILIWVGMLGSAYVAGKKMHLSIDFFTGKFTGRVKYWSEIFIQACVFLFGLFGMVIGGVYLVYLTLYLQQTSAALQIPLGYVYIAIPVGGLLIMYYSASALYEHTTQKITE